MEKELTLGKQRLKLTSLEKMLFPQDKISKEQVIDYYLKISHYLLRYIKNRPLTLQRFPKGIQQPGFIQKHGTEMPQWIKRVTLPTKTSSMEYLIATKKSDIGFLANLNTISFHVAFSTIARIDVPDILIWDLDSNDANFKKVIKVAFIVKELADKLKLITFIKTTGSKGLHIYAPLKKRFNFEFVHDFAKKFAFYLADRYPTDITINQSIAEREGRILIDYARNSYGQTAIAPYSLRALETAPIATPIEWEELGTVVKASNQFNLGNIQERLKEKGDVWDKQLKFNDLAKPMQILKALIGS
jgi:bifunctional non-homologous end joining protein LigD